MQISKTIVDIRTQLNRIYSPSTKVAVVPTMGNLHEGHLALVKEAKKLADYVVVTIFVNPTQFVAGEDFDNYPRTLTEDLASLAELDVDLVFTPDAAEIYSDDLIKAEVTVPELDGIYCGEFRPGHFKGVATIVLKLFNIIQADLALFGQKDYQQLLIIKSLVTSLNLPIEIIGFPIIRETDGLAMSSRNRYLTAAERKIAPALYQCLQETANALEAGDTDYKKLENKAITQLNEAGFKPEYFSVCDAKTLKPPVNHELIVISAGWLGKARLIDNVAVHTYD